MDLPGEERTVELISQRGERSTCVLRYGLENALWYITYTWPPIGNAKFYATDLFECFRELRRALQPLGWNVLCNGARKDAWASGMSRQMGGGVNLFLVTRPPRSFDDLVFIFDPAPPESLATVEEQEKFVMAWLDGRPMAP